nr:polyketide cyclase [Afipia sp.]
MTAYKIDPKLDLVLERVIDVPPELVWKVWTEPKHLMPWFTPKPWQ